MSVKNGQIPAETLTLPPIPVEEFARSHWDDMVPLDPHFGYFAAGVNIPDDDVKDYLREPVAALSPAIVQLLPKLRLLFVPYVEKISGKNGSTTYAVTAVKPSKDKLTGVARVEWRGEMMFLFGMQEPNLGDFHYFFYRAIARLVAEGIIAPAHLDAYAGLVLDEIRARTHGEVDEDSWTLKQELLQRTQAVKRSTRGFKDYVQTSLIDTLTLYQHGICCDIDIEPGPRQIPSRPLRKRLEMLESFYPPPKGKFVFPDDLKR